MSMNLVKFKENINTSIYLGLVVLPPYESNQQFIERAMLRPVLYLSVITLACISLAYSDLWQLNRESTKKGRS